MTTRSVAAFVVFLALCAVPAFSAAPEGSPADSPGLCVGDPAVSASPAPREAARFPDLQLAIPASGGSCVCGQGLQSCCGCNPCPQSGTGWCCGLQGLNGICYEVRSCGCLAC